MNQILMVEDKKKNKKRNSTPIEIKNIIRFFSIVIIIFALFIISHSSYALYRDARGNNTDNLAEINLSRVKDTLIVDVQSVNTIDKFKYSWENSEQKSIPKGAKSFQEEIILPNENNILTIILEDETGRAVTYTKEIILDGIDITKPEISIEKQSTGVKLIAKDETDIAYLTYRIDDGEEIRIDKSNDNNTIIEYILTEIERGEHIIYVTAVDSVGNFAEEEQNIIVSSDKPQITELSIDKENSKIIIGASDVDGIRAIEVNLNGAVYSMNNVNKKEAKFSLDIKEGTNTISIKLTNVNGITAEGAREFNYAK